MEKTKAAFDTHVLLYLLSEDLGKAEQAEEIMAQGGILSVQVLNEFTSVARRKLRMDWTEIREVLQPIKQICTIVPVTHATHEQGLDIAQHYGYSIYDALILSAALQAQGTLLYTEDMQHGQTINKTLKIENPFK